MDFEPLSEEVYSNLPNFLKKLTGPFEGREKDIVLLSSIGVLSNTFPNVYGKYAGDEVSANLYIMILAPPASGKGVMNYSRYLIEKIDRHLLDKSAQAQKAWKKKKQKGEEDLGLIPPIRLKIIPGNISSADLYDKIMNSHHGGIIIESEADTLNAIMKQDFGDFSDVLRKAFHHENLSISRKTEKQFDKIYSPKLSLLISGTPDQLDPFIKSTSNGLFSRMIFYYFNEIGEFKEVFSESSGDPVNLFSMAGDALFGLYGELAQRQKRLQFRLTQKQIAAFQTEITSIYEIVCTQFELEFISTVKRHGLILFRISMILTIIRKRKLLSEKDIVHCGDQDFRTSLLLVKNLLYHAYTIFNLRNKVELPQTEQKILDSLEAVFLTSDAVNIGRVYGFSERTIADKLKKWIGAKKIVKVFHGRYRQMGK